MKQNWHFMFKLYSFIIKVFATIGIYSFLLIPTGCSKEIERNQHPDLNISYIAEGLNVKLIGNAIDADGFITELKIEWDDGKTSILYNNNYPNLEFSHLYTEPADLSIMITAIDNTGDTTLQILPIKIDFKETSLAGIKESMFKTSENEFLILTLNLHTYQETQQSEKLNMITDVIGKMDIDFVAFQECAQNKSALIYNGIIRSDNMALIITDKLKEKYTLNYNYIWNWAHYGWNIWEEGVAVLSKHPITDSEDKYISTRMEVNNITSRKVIYGNYLTSAGHINIFSAHVHWRTSLTDEEQNNQIKKIQSMVNEKELLSPSLGSFVCGDFNGNPTDEYPWSEGYNTMTMTNIYLDSFLKANPDANNRPAQSKYFTIGGSFPGRIDYIFMKNNSDLIVVESQIIFTDNIVGNVSDHNGVLTKVIYNP